MLFGWIYVLSWIAAPLFLDWIDRVNEAGGANGTDGVDEGDRTRQGD